MLTNTSASDRIWVVHGPTPDPGPGAPGRERVAAQSRGARACLAAAARGCGAPTGPYEKDASGAPLPLDGWHWSLTHDAQRVAAALARERVGLDLERVCERRAELVERVLDPGERRVLRGPVTPLAFTQVWTAKEAVLKAAGVGLQELSRCRLLSLKSGESCLLAHRGALARVRFHMFADHVLAVHAPSSLEVSWTILDSVA